jgi:hypothetical protein
VVADAAGIEDQWVIRAGAGFDDRADGDEARLAVGRVEIAVGEEANDGRGAGVTFQPPPSVDMLF